MNINLSFYISDAKLFIIADEEARRQILEEYGEDLSSDKTMYEVFENLICNSELNWVDPAETGDLTDAPMLGIYDGDETVTERWAFMDYQLRSPVEDLIEKGTVVFIQ